MTEPFTSAPHLPQGEREPTWLERNRLALLALVPLLLLAGLATSFRYVTLYRPNEFTQPQKASGPGLNFHENFMSVGFGTQPRQYARNVTITLRSLKAGPEYQGEKAARGATLWVTELQFQAKPDVPLEGCHLALVDEQGEVYGDQSGKTGESSDVQRHCVPLDTPGPTFDFTGELREPSGAARPESWTVRRTVALPEGKRPRFVRVSWRPPHYGLIPLK